MTIRILTPTEDFLSPLVSTEWPTRLIVLESITRNGGCHLIYSGRMESLSACLGERGALASLQGTPGAQCVPRLLSGPSSSAGHMNKNLSAVHRLIKRIHHLRIFVTAALHALTHAQEQQLLATLKKSQDNQIVA